MTIGAAARIEAATPGILNVPVFHGMASKALVERLKIEAGKN